MECKKWVGISRGNLFIAYAISRHHIAEEPPPRLFIFSVEVSSGRSLGRGRGCSGRGGRWGERPPARSPAAGVVEGGGGALGFRVTWVRGAP